MLFRGRHKVLRHVVPAMAGSAGHLLVLRRRIRIVDLRQVSLVDSPRHTDHQPRRRLIRLRVRRKVQLVGLWIHCVAEVAPHPERSRVPSHDFPQFLGSCVLRQNLQVHRPGQRTACLIVRSAWRAGFLNCCKNRLHGKGKDKNSSKQQTALHAFGYLGIGVSPAGSKTLGNRLPIGRIPPGLSFTMIKNSFAEGRSSGDEMISGQRKPQRLVGCFPNAHAWQHGNFPRHEPVVLHMQP